MSKKKLPKLSEVGQKQASVVMREFHSGELRSRSGEPVKDVNQAQAIAMQEGRAAEKYGTAKRTWKGKTRMRPILPEKK